MIEFPSAGDVCYLAYHYPYTYTRLLTDIQMWTRKAQSSKNNENINSGGDSKEKNQSHTIEFQTGPDDGILFSVHELCRTILNNPVPIITITNWANEIAEHQVTSKQYVFLTSRVHPGESNASWVIKGCVDFLISDNPIASQLRDLYIFKIVPMLNPDGVINGCYRCSMAGQDLNRRWLDPCEVLNPTIYATKGLLMYLTKLGQTPLVYCDFHGHSRRKNVFMFGCSPLQSWISDDSNNPAYVDQKNEDQSYYTLPSVLNKIAHQFSLDCCKFSIDKAKESTGRVVVWRQFGIKRSYTMESSFCSCDQGIYKNQHINVPMLEDMGARFAESLLHLEEINSGSVQRYTNLGTTNPHDKTASFKVECSPSPGYIRLNSITNQKSVDKRVENDDDVDDGDEDNDEEDDDEEAVSGNEEEDADEESDKDNENIDEYGVEDSD